MSLKCTIGDRICEVCGVPFHVPPRALKRSACRCCSRRCADAFKRQSWEKRFWERVEKTETCWLWRGALTRGGYGTITHHGHPHRAHRLSWILHNGPIPHGLFVCHNCPGGDQKRCVNPAHLFLGTTTDNMRDAVRKGQLAYGERNGAAQHPDRICRGSSHGRAVLTEQQVREIRVHYDRRDGTTVSLGREYGVSQVLCSMIVRGKIWTHVDPPYSERTKRKGRRARPPMNRGEDWEQDRFQAIERDNGTCCECGKIVGRSIIVHHIKPFREFPTSMEANQLSNLECLCRACHIKKEPPPRAF
jgi:hypothetical protein